MHESSVHEYLYFMYHTECVCYFSFAFDVIWFLPLRGIVFDCQMSEYFLPYIGFADGASHSTRNLASAAWEIYVPTNELISLRGVCLGRATNNIAEYSVVIELFVDAISLGIRHLVVRLDLQLVVLQLSNVYSIRSPTLLRVYLQIRLLERHFDHIEYQHIPQCLNTLTDALANYVLDRHLDHL
jgi:ribonuclease HI